MNRNSNRRIHPIAEADGLSPKKPRKANRSWQRRAQQTSLYSFRSLHGISDSEKSPFRENLGTVCRNLGTKGYSQ